MKNYKVCIFCYTKSMIEVNIISLVLNAFIWGQGKQKPWTPPLKSLTHEQVGQ